MNEIQFVVEKATDGGLIARAIGVSIFTEAADMKNLRLQIADHFDEGKAPQRIILC
jgi:hypothetical protein